MQKTAIPKLKFYNDREILQLGLGTWLLDDVKSSNSIKFALNNGYRLLDSASMYQNGRILQKGIKDSGIDRKEIFITSKIDPGEQGYDKTRTATDQILKDLGTDYVNLMLVHWPGCYGVSAKNNPKIRLETYRALEDLQKEGKIVDIGVSNFVPKHLVHLLENCKVKPVLNQMETHPLGWDQQTVEFCQKNDIIIQQYCPLAQNDNRLMKNQDLINIAKKYQRSVAQIVLRWGVQHGFSQIPKSKTEKYILENMNIFDFELEQDDVKIIDGMNKGIRKDWNPYSIEY